MHSAKHRVEMEACSFFIDMVKSNKISKKDWLLGMFMYSGGVGEGRPVPDDGRWTPLGRMPGSFWLGVRVEGLSGADGAVWPHANV